MAFEGHILVVTYMAITYKLKVVICFLAHWQNAKEPLQSCIVFIVIVVICDQFSYTHTESEKVPSLTVVALSYNFTSTKVHFCMY